MNADIMGTIGLDIKSIYGCSSSQYFPWSNRKDWNSYCQDVSKVIMKILQVY